MSFGRSGLIGLGFLLTSIVSGGPALAMSSLRICNETGEKIWISFAYIQGLNVLTNRWTSVGRYDLEHRECFTPFETDNFVALRVAVLHKTFFGGMEPMSANVSADGAESLKFGYSICVDPNGPFERTTSIADLKSCPPDWSLVPAFYVSKEVSQSARVYIEG